MIKTINPRNSTHVWCKGKFDFFGLCLYFLGQGLHWQLASFSQISFLLSRQCCWWSDNFLIWHTHKEIGDAWGIVSCYTALATIFWAKARVESFQPGPKPLQSAAVTTLQEIMVNVPNNVAQLTILLIGNFKKSDVSLLLKQYFEHWCDPPAPPHPWWLYCSHRLQTAQLCVQIDALCVACVTHNRSMKPE